MNQRQSPIRVQTLDDFKAAACSEQHPICILSRKLPFDFRAAAKVLSRLYDKQKSEIKNLELLIRNIPEIEKQQRSSLWAWTGINRKNAQLYNSAQEQLEFIASDLQIYKIMGYRPTLHFKPAAKFSADISKLFHCDSLLIGQNRIMCSYTDDTTESMDDEDAEKTEEIFGITFYEKKPRAEIQSLITAGDITKHDKHWIHRAPKSKRPRLLMIGYKNPDAAPA